MKKIFFLIIMATLINTEVSYPNVEILQPENGRNYLSNNIKMKLSIDNTDGTMDSIIYQFAGGSMKTIQRINTDWYTYMQNDFHHGYSQSVAPKDSNILWRSPVTGFYHEFCSPVIVNGIVYYASDEKSTLFALDAETGDIIWSYNIIDFVDNAVTVKYGKVYVSADSVWCLNANTGERIWAYGGTKDYYTMSTPAVDNGMVYLNNTYYFRNILSFQVLSLDAETGILNWKKIF